MAQELITRTETEVADDGENAMVAQSLQLSDLSRHSILSIMARGAWAPELSELYSAGLQIAEGYYIQTASGSGLDRRLADFGLSRPEEVAAYGQIRFIRSGGSSGDVMIPQGYTVAATDAEGNPIEYATDAETVIPDGSESALATVTCSSTGIVGNVGSNAITELTGGAINNLGGVSNLYGFTSGRDLGTDVETRQVFWDFLEARSRTTVAALKYAARSYVDSVTGQQPIHSASVQEYLDEEGPDGVTVQLYIMGHSGEVPSDELVTAVQQHINGYTGGEGQEIEGWRAAGCDVEVSVPTLKPASIRVSLDLAPTASANTINRLLRALSSYVANIPVGEPLRVMRIFGEITALGSDIENATVVEPAADQPAAINEKWVQGTIDVLG